MVACNDPDTRIQVAQIGKFDESMQQWVSQQAYAVGVLLSSSNASTWTPHQEYDMRFRLLEADFQGKTERVLDLGSVNVKDATDFLLYAAYETPSAACDVAFSLTFDDGSVHTVAAGQPFMLSASYTGPVNVKARLMGDENFSAALVPGAQLLAGRLMESADYYSRSITAAGAVKATLIYDALIPPGATVTPQIQLDSGEWRDIPQTGATKGDNGMVEYTRSLAIENVSLLKARFTLTGSTSARPLVRNIRLLATA